MTCIHLNDEGKIFSGKLTEIFQNGAYFSEIYGSDRGEQTATDMAIFRGKNVGWHCNENMKAVRSELRNNKTEVTLLKLMVKGRYCYCIELRIFSDGFVLFAYVTANLPKTCKSNAFNRF